MSGGERTSGDMTARETFSGATSSGGISSGETPSADPWELPVPRKVLPEGLDEMAPGAELGNCLESIDRDELNGYELIVVLRAEARQIAHLQARFYADVVEMAHTPWGDVDSAPERMPLPDEMAFHELRAALMLTRRAAATHLDVAFSLARLPQVRTALAEGRLDLARARLMCQETEHLSVPEAHLVVNGLLEEAPGLTTGQLGARLRRRCLEVDPDAAHHRYQQALGERHLEGRQNPDGTADLWGRHLPVERVASILSRINAQARKLRGRDGRTLDQIRADLFMDLLEGRHAPAGPGGGAVEIRVDLTTLIGLDERAADLPGWGPVVADVARRVIHQRSRARWEIVVTDPETGRPLDSVTTRRRPTAAQARRVIARDQRCVFVGCRVPARRSHLDHTHPYHQGGATREDNLAPLCEGDHLGPKHEGGWHLSQPQPGHYRWISPRGHLYEVHPQPP